MESVFDFLTQRPTQESTLKKQLAERAAPIIAEEFPNLRLIILYGSVARGNARKDSDVDLALIFSGSRQTLPNIFNHYETLAEKFHEESIPFPHPHIKGGLNLHPLPEQEYAESSDPFIRNTTNQF